MRRIEAKDLGFLNDMIAEDPQLQNALTEALDRKLGRMRLMFSDPPSPQAIVNQGTGHELIQDHEPLPPMTLPPRETAGPDIPSDLNKEEAQIVQWFRVRAGTANRKGDCERMLNLPGNAFDVAWRTVKARGLILCEGSGPGARFRFYRS